jgi:hypothetical protein
LSIFEIVAFFENRIDAALDLDLANLANTTPAAIEESTTPRKNCRLIKKYIPKQLLKYGSEAPYPMDDIVCNEKNTA